jgi:hypothetical protein
MIDDKHNCDENNVTKCDGDIHIHSCSVCGKYLGETNCPDRGMW